MLSVFAVLLLAATVQGDNNSLGAHHAKVKIESRCYVIGNRTGCVRGRLGRNVARRPLLLFLHGYGGEAKDDALSLMAESELDDILYASANGSPDDRGQLTWAAIDRGGRVADADHDDVAFLSTLIERIKSEWPVDSRRVYAAGWSLGGFMALRLACSTAATLAAVVSYAGAMDAKHGHCEPSEPVSVLLIHGDADRGVSYEGGRGSRTGLVYTSAKTTFEIWAKLDRCVDSVEMSPQMLDIDQVIEGPETRQRRYSHCGRETVVELWTVAHGEHRPRLTSDGTRDIVRFLLGHPKR